MKYLFSILYFIFSNLGTSLCLAETDSPLRKFPSEGGIIFHCSNQQAELFQIQLKKYLSSLKIKPQWIRTFQNKNRNRLQLSLATHRDDTSTLDFHQRPEFQIHDEVISLPQLKGKPEKVITVSKKEILLSLLQHGRTTTFPKNACHLQALKEHIELRQNIVAWTEDVDWFWPENIPAFWNSKYWKEGTPVRGKPLTKILMDPFLEPEKYAFGCYTAAKLIFAHGILDYYARVIKNSKLAKLIQRKLMKDGEPLVHVEPGKMWYFEPDSSPKEISRPGKILTMVDHVAPKNFVPGDWVYFYNNDPVSHAMTGYEGSNPIYLGRNKFSDYYNLNNHGYTLHEKLYMVYQWRHGVLDPHEDAAKAQPISQDQLDALTAPPEKGGFLLSYRAFPQYLGYSRK